MTEAITWKYVSKGQLQALAGQYDTDSCKRTLAEIFHLELSNEKHDLLMTFYFTNYTFCRQHHLPCDAISVVLGIGHILISNDFLQISSKTTIQSSYQMFQSLVLLHSVNRSPKSVEIFTLDQVNLIVNFMTHSYYRHFHLYKCIFTPFIQYQLVQNNVNNVEVPRACRALNEGYLFEHKEIHIEKIPDDTNNDTINEIKE